MRPTPLQRLLAAWPVWLPALLGGLIHLPWIREYGWFRDELYYLACAQRPTWGYVDQPPLSIMLLRAVVSVFGDDIAVVRSIAVVTMSCVFGLTAAIARRLGADDWSACMAGLASAIVPVYLVLGHIYSMNGLDVLAWTLAAWLVLRQMEDEQGWRWPVLGLVLGAGLLNKLSVLWLLAGLLVALLFTPWRTWLRKPGPYVAVAIALALFSPYVVWQAQHHWITLEFMRNALLAKMRPIPPWEFVATQLVVMHLAVAPFYLGGLWWAFRVDKESKGKVFAWVFLTVVAILLLNSRSRPNYLSPAYPPLIAAGAVWLGAKLRGRTWRLGATGALLAFAAPSTMLVIPTVPIDKLVQGLELLPVQPPREEKGETSPAQGYADMIGWHELALAVDRALDALPPQDRARARVFTSNYGEAAALEYYSREFGFPSILSGHNNYWLWGWDGWDGSVLVVVNEIKPELRARFASFTEVGRVHAPHAMPEQRNAPIFIARGLRGTVVEFWREARMMR